MASSISQAPALSPVSLTRPVMESFKPAKIFPASSKETDKIVTSMSFDSTGDNLVVANTADSFDLYNCRTGKWTKVGYSKKYGIDHVRYTNGSKNSLLHSSTKENHDIRQMSLNTITYQTYFSGHSDLVLSLSTNPVNDTFVSSSMDKTVRLWDMRQRECTGKLETGKDPVAAYDNTGKIFAVAHNDNRQDAIHLFGCDNYSQGSFAVIPLIDPALASSNRKDSIITSLAFSPDGTHLLVGTTDDTHYVLDAYDGHLLRRLTGHRGLGMRNENGTGKPNYKSVRAGSGQELSWSPDGRYVAAGSADAHLLVWDIIEKPTEGLQPPVRHDGPQWWECEPILRREGGNNKPVRVVSFNPRSAILATGADHLALWVPERDKVEETRASRAT